MVSYKDVFQELRNELVDSPTVQGIIAALRKLTKEKLEALRNAHRGKLTLDDLEKIEEFMSAKFQGEIKKIG